MPEDREDWIPYLGILAVYVVAMVVIAFFMSYLQPVTNIK